MNEEKVAFVVLIKDQSKCYIMSGNNGQVAAFETQKEACSYFESGYNEKHAQGYQGSMSAAIHFISFHPKIIRVETLNDLKTKIAADPPQLYRIGNVAGSMMGISTRPEAMQLWESGIDPKLIDHDEVQRLTKENNK